MSDDNKKSNRSTFCLTTLSVSFILVVDLFGCEVFFSLVMVNLNFNWWRSSLILIIYIYQKSLAVVLLLLTAVSGYRILVLIPFPGPSHFLMFKVLIKELISRGHEVTAITAFPMKETINNYTEVLIHPRFLFDASCEF